MSELRALIREILVEELAALRAAPAATPACEMVDVHSDEALMAFARDLLGRANDPEFVRCVQSGQHRFTLAPTVAQPPGQRPAPAPSVTLVGRRRGGRGGGAPLRSPWWRRPPQRRRALKKPWSPNAMSPPFQETKAASGSPGTPGRRRWPATNFRALPSASKIL